MHTPNPESRMRGFDTLPARFANRICREIRVPSLGECWTWTGWLSDKGYAIALFGKRKVKLHRFAYELLVGPIPDGLLPDHLCRNRACINPAHLECVTNRENILRGVGLAAVNAKKTHCVNGHAFTSENTQVEYSAEG